MSCISLGIYVLGKAPLMSRNSATACSRFAPGTLDEGCNQMEQVNGCPAGLASVLLFVEDLVFFCFVDERLFDA
jgi:hypothetical protein